MCIPVRLQGPHWGLYKYMNRPYALLSEGTRCGYANRCGAPGHEIDHMVSQYASTEPELGILQQLLATLRLLDGCDVICTCSTVGHGPVHDDSGGGCTLELC